MVKSKRTGIKAHGWQASAEGCQPRLSFGLCGCPSLSPSVPNGGTPIRSAPRARHVGGLLDSSISLALHTQSNRPTGPAFQLQPHSSPHVTTSRDSLSHGRSLPGPPSRTGQAQLFPHHSRSPTRPEICLSFPELTTQIRYLSSQLLRKSPDHVTCSQSPRTHDLCPVWTALMCFVSIGGLLHSLGGRRAGPLPSRPLVKHTLF